MARTPVLPEAAPVGAVSAPIEPFAVVTRYVRSTSTRAVPRGAANGRVVWKRSTNRELARRRDFRRVEPNGNLTCVGEPPICATSSRSIWVKNLPSRDLPSTRSPNTPRRSTRDSALSDRILRTGSTAFMDMRNGVHGHAQWSRKTAAAASLYLAMLALCFERF